MLLVKMQLRLSSELPDTVCFPFLLHTKHTFGVELERLVKGSHLEVRRAEVL